VKQVIVCLKIEYDETEYHDPKYWNWQEIVDLTNVRIVSVYKVEKREEVNPS
jgi:hypothetical protein